ncbi:hypothetical protein [Myceligenerans indicum]|uniref:Extracellular solute-binding protein n=1 Tax=Myceligenerans indicum TaxID=2593663 RepID=A0ABS1LQ65_9MICO|nr:hypothetical protein [Myceligenerans indicum]MBL0888431.1 hypothetical protein [Myceligenerans indicum]
MDRKILRIRISVAMTVGALVLSAAAWGTGLDCLGRNEDDGLRVLVGPDNGGGTKSVRAAVRAWSESSGREVRVAVAADMPQRLSRGFANGNPPDVFALDADELTAYATRGFLRPYRDGPSPAERLRPALVEALTVDGDLVCAPKETRDTRDVVQLSGGTPDPGARQFTECWGIAADSADHEAAVDLVRHLTRSASDADR